MRFLFLISIFLYSMNGVAVSLPQGCHAVAIKGDALIVEAVHAQLVYIYNHSDADLWLTHPDKEPGLSAGWTSRLQAGHWSALKVAKGPFALTCIESRPGHEQEVPCEGLIMACQWQTVKMSPTKGTFWAAEDLLLDELNAAVVQRGFVFGKK
ncbi:MAG: hypothetical protein CK426_00100 [Legionella sp.]|nr:MAG: hypothetical protein CK423_07930 [Legionella sp.]PJE00262.1 MAG: hypothetical protein CK426_00100 [Legionella sp.]